MKKFVHVFAALAFIALAAPASAQGIYHGGSYKPGLVPWRGHTSLGPWGVQRHPRHHRQSYLPGGAFYHGNGYAERGSGMIVRSYTVPLSSTCHDWVMQGGVKVYTRHYAC